MEKKDMTRRTALKIMGSAALATMMATTGASALTSCIEGRKKRVVLYFTGTGNCLYVARELAGNGRSSERRVPSSLGLSRVATDEDEVKDGEILSIPQLMRKKRFDIEADEIGLVYPVYGHMPPNMVREFIKKARLKAEYKFAVLTYGMRKCNSVEIWDEVSRKAGNSFDYINTLIMVDNWLPNFDMNEQMKIDKHIPENLAKIITDLNSRRRWHEPVTQEEREQHEGFMRLSGLDPEVGFLMKSEKYFTVTDACIDCGICTYVCPRGNYDLTSQGVKMQGDCEFCFACIQNCPQKAIQFKKIEDGTWPDGSEKNPNARYRNENVSLMDLKLSNNQK